MLVPVGEKEAGLGRVNFARLFQSSVVSIVNHVAQIEQMVKAFTFTGCGGIDNVLPCPV